MDPTTFSLIGSRVSSGSGPSGIVWNVRSSPTAGDDLFGVTSSVTQFIAVGVGGRIIGSS